MDVFESRRGERGDYYQLQACRVVDIGDTSCERYVVRRHGMASSPVACAMEVL
jgi:hypothetical protein